MKMRRVNRIAAWMFSLALVLGVAVAVPAFAAPEQPRQATSTETTAPNGAVPDKEEQEKDENYEYTHSPNVEKIGHMLGMSPDTAATTFTVLNFVVLLVGIGYMMIKLLPKA